MSRLLPVSWLLLPTCALLGALCGACGGDESKATGKTASSEVEHAEQAEDPPLPAPAADDAPATQRLLGKWRMNLDEVPDSALTKDFADFKKQGMAGVVRIEYTVTEREFILDKYGAGGRLQKRWFYEVLKEDGDALMLERSDETGRKQQIPASLEGNEGLRIGTGNGIVPLKRVRD